MPATTPVAVLDSGVRLALPSAGDARDGDPITVMLRPERITLGAADSPSDGRSLPATVQDVIFQGSSLRLIADAPGDTELLVTVETDDDTPDLRPGDAISLHWSPGAAYLLRGRSEIIGATTTDVDEVQASMDGKDVAEAKADDAREPKEPRFSRRSVLIGGGVVAVAAVGAVLLSGVGSGDDDAAALPEEGEGTAGGGIGQGATELNFINWTEYIDPTEGDELGTVDRFQDATGIAVNYSETYNDNNEVYGKEFAAYLDAGNPTPWDIAAPTYWMAARLKSNGWLAPLPFNLIPNYVNLDPIYLDQAWDLGAKYHLPWQAGITGIAYNISATGGRELRSISELFDEEFHGRIGFFSEMRDTVGLVMLSQGNDPATATEETMNQALDTIEQATNDGQVRRFTGNDYLQDIENGNFAACIAWSGDIAQSPNPDVRLRVPGGGGDLAGSTRWSSRSGLPTGSPRRSGWTSCTTPSTRPA